MAYVWTLVAQYLQLFLGGTALGAPCSYLSESAPDYKSHQSQEFSLAYGGPEPEPGPIHRDTENKWHATISPGKHLESQQSFTDSCRVQKTQSLETASSPKVTISCGGSCALELSAGNSRTCPVGAISLLLFQYCICFMSVFYQVLCGHFALWTACMYVKVSSLGVRLALPLHW